MTDRKIYHVTKRDDGKGWQGKLEGGLKASVTGATKEEVLRATTELAKRAPLGQVVVHKQDGTFQREWTYGKDPFPPKG